MIFLLPRMLLNGITDNIFNRLIWSNLSRLTSSKSLIYNWCMLFVMSQSSTVFVCLVNLKSVMPLLHFDIFSCERVDMSSLVPSSKRKKFLLGFSVVVFETVVMVISFFRVLCCKKNNEKYFFSCSVVFHSLTMLLFGC
jgi:hypothetical protein